MRTFWNDSMVMLPWPTLAAKSRRLRSLIFLRDDARGDDAERREGERDEREFPVDAEHDAEHEEDGARFLDEVGEAELEEVVEGGAVGLDAADELAGGGLLEEIEREGADLAEGVALDVVGDALAAPGQEVAAAVAEQRRAGRR